MKLSVFDIFETFQRKFKYIELTNVYIAMSLNETHFLEKTDVNIYEERITLHEKMRTRLTLEQKRWIIDVIGRLNYYFTTKAVDFYRYDVFQRAYNIAIKKALN